MFALDEACFEEPFWFSLRAMRRFAGAKRAATILAEDEDGRLVGFVVAHQEEETVYIVTVDVAQAYRRQGIGWELMQRVERAFAKARRVELHVFTENAAVIRFYEGMGYQQIGEKPGFYGRDAQGNRLDGWVYTKALGC